MREAKKRKFYTPEYKTKVGLEALRGVKTINELGQEYAVHPVQVGQWMKAITLNRKRAQRLMRQIGLAAIVPGPNTRRAF